MIGKDEILAFADETGLTPNVVEKDSVLGWLLAAINTNPVLSQSWVFKGGTCLKKCYFETYRFSEDLDFPARIGSDLPNYLFHFSLCAIYAGYFSLKPPFCFQN